MVVGRLLSYWEGHFSGARLNFGSVCEPFLAPLRHPICQLQTSIPGISSSYEDRVNVSPHATCWGKVGGFFYKKNSNKHLIYDIYIWYIWYIWYIYDMREVVIFNCPPSSKWNPFNHGRRQDESEWKIGQKSKGIDLDDFLLTLAILWDFGVFIEMFSSSVFCIKQVKHLQRCQNIAGLRRELFLPSTKVSYWRKEIQPCRKNIAKPFNILKTRKVILWV